MNRIFCEGPLASGAELSLSPAGAYHVARVLRMREGAWLAIFDGGGQEFRAEIVRVAGDAVTVRLGESTSGAAESPLRITLLQGVSRSERMDWTLQKASELGVRTIVPVLSSRSVVRLDERQAEKKTRHWQAIVAAACEQCGRSVVPEVRVPQDLSRYLGSSAREGQRFVLSPTGPASLAGLSSVGPRVELLIGPEGGLDDTELERASATGFAPVRLGPRVLRTETAGIVALTVLQALWGDLA